MTMAELDAAIYRAHWRCSSCDGLLPPEIKPKGTATADCGCAFNVCCEINERLATKRAESKARRHAKTCKLALKAA